MLVRWGLLERLSALLTVYIFRLRMKETFSSTFFRLSSLARNVILGLPWPDTKRSRVGRTGRGRDKARILPFTHYSATVTKSGPTTLPSEVGQESGRGMWAVRQRCDLTQAFALPALPRKSKVDRSIIRSARPSSCIGFALPRCGSAAEEGSEPPPQNVSESHEQGWTRSGLPSHVSFIRKTVESWCLQI